MMIGCSFKVVLFFLPESISLPHPVFMKSLELYY